MVQWPLVGHSKNEIIINKNVNQEKQNNGNKVNTQSLNEDTNSQKIYKKKFNKRLDQTNERKSSGHLSQKKVKKWSVLKNERNSDH